MPPSVIGVEYRFRAVEALDAKTLVVAVVARFEAVNASSDSPAGVVAEVEDLVVVSDTNPDIDANCIVLVEDWALSRPFEETWVMNAFVEAGLPTILTTLAMLGVPPALMAKSM